MSTMEEGSAIDALCAVDLAEEDYPVERLGLTLRIRALTHFEALEMQEYARKPDVTNAMYEQRMLSAAIVWPKMSAGQVKGWQKASPAGEINGVMKVVTRLSGMGAEEAKDAYKSDAGEPDAGE